MPTQSEVHAAIVQVIEFIMDNAEGSVLLDLLAYAAVLKSRAASQDDQDAIQAGVEHLIARREGVPASSIPVGHTQIVKDSRRNLSEITILDSGVRRKITETEEQEARDVIVPWTGMGVLE